MLELGLRELRNLKYMDFHRYSFSKLAFMLNITSKSENETFLITSVCEFTETWVVTQREIKLIKKKEGNQNPQNNMIASCSFASTAVELSKSTGWDFESMIKFFRLDGTRIIYVNRLRFWVHDYI